MKKVVIIDVDGTITNFYEIDHKIISSIYSAKMVFLLDKLLWKINSLDVISNKYSLFKLRIFIYSLLSFHSYKKDLVKYKSMYEKKAKGYFNNFLRTEYKALKRKGYDVIILTCDPFDAYVESRAVISQHKPQYVIDNIPSRYDEVIVIGNNFMDDILSGLRLRKKTSMKVKILYVGNSKLLKRMLEKKCVCFFCETLKEAISQII